MIDSDKWQLMSEKERHEYILSRLKSGELEIVYVRPGSGLFYITIAPALTGMDAGPTREVGRPIDDDYDGTNAYPDEN